MSKWEHIWKWSLVFILIHMSSGASVIALSDVAISLFTGLTIGLAYLKRVRIDKHFFTFTYIFICLSFFYMMQFGWLNYTASLRLFLKILYAYLTIKLLGGRFLHVTEDIIAKLAAISLPLFAIQYVAPDLMSSINDLSEYIIPQVPKGEGVNYSNSIIYTVNPWGIDRNSGFMWEPGAFAAMVSVGAFLNLILNGYRRNWHLVFLLIALLTAKSTTGNLLFVLVALFWLINQRSKTIIMTLPLMTLMVMLFMSSGEGREKVKDRWENWDKTIDNQDSYADDREGISVGRFGSFVLDWNDVMRYPIIGFGLQEAERTTGRYIHLVRANGFSDYMARFGLFGIVFLLINLSLTFRHLGKVYGGRGFWMGTLIVLVLSFSNPLLLAPFFFALQFHHIACRRQEIYDHRLIGEPQADSQTVQTETLTQYHTS